jgi:hypothetical protein
MTAAGDARRGKFSASFEDYARWLTSSPLLDSAKVGGSRETELNFSPLNSIGSQSSSEWESVLNINHAEALSGLLQFEDKGA